jgi:hypothetical protein
METTTVKVAPGVTLHPVDKKKDGHTAAGTVGNPMRPHRTKQVLFLLYFYFISFT